jgi:hypothetical protein
MTNIPNIPQKTPKKRKSRAGLSLKKVNLDHLHKQLLNILSRETLNLLTLSSQGKLEKDDAASLCNYIKLMQYLAKKEEEDLENLSDEELEKLAKVKANGSK